MKIITILLSKRRGFALLLTIMLLAACGRGAAQPEPTQAAAGVDEQPAAASNVVVGDGEASPYNGTFLEGDNPAFPITATNEENETFDMSELQGNYVLVNFGYTSCPDICPVTLANLMLAYNELSEAQQEQVDVLFVTVDPARDTPERLNSYLSSFSEDFSGLYIPDEQDLETVKAAYGVFSEVREPEETGEVDLENYFVDHTGGVYVIGPEGTFKLFLSHDASADAIRSDLLTLMEG